MKQKDTYYNQFLKEKKKLVTSLLKEYNEKIDKAQEGYQQNIKNKIFYNFHTKNREKQTELGVNQRFFLELEESLLEDKHKKIEIEFEKKFSLIEGDKETILINIAELQSYLEVIQTINEQDIEIERKNKVNENEELTNNPIKWKGQELEFIQLVYSLFEAGCLSNDQNQVTKLVEQVAKVFNFKLSKYWQQTKSNSINDRNNDYEPDIFIKLQSAYNDHTTKKTLKKAQRK